MQSYFHEVVALLEALVGPGERFLASFAAERSHFVRFNGGRVRQAGSVTQAHLTVDLIRGRRHLSGEVTLGGVLDDDRAVLARLVEDLRESLGHVPEDPWFLCSEEGGSSERVGTAELPAPAEVIETVTGAAAGRDLVGIYAGGSTLSGFASSWGRRSWHEQPSFNLDLSLHGDGDRAVKGAYAGFTWARAELDARVARAISELEVAARPALRIEPGRYRCYLAPAAVFELLGVLAWGGFGLKAHRTKTTPLIAMVEGGATLDPSVTIAEWTAGGIAPHVQEQGFARPDRITLVDRGSYAECLVSPRSAAEYACATNGAAAEEMPLSWDVAAGTLTRDAALADLGTGVWIGNLWYVNYSDRPACRTTGMTRFGTFWVEDGEIRAPLEVMRYDETLYHMLGDRLMGLTAERDTILDASSYGRRSLVSAHVPGALVDGLSFTL